MRSAALQAAAATAAALFGAAAAHGDHGAAPQKPMVSADADWMTKHMAEEHHIGSYDAASFFGLHDFNNNGFLEPDELLRTYGLYDVSNRDVPPSRHDEISRELLRLLGAEAEGRVSRAQFETFFSGGGRLPDMGVGPGHHGDDEYEYEIHHWEKYHDENTRLEDLTHPEDIEHFKMHEKMEAEQEQLEKMEQMMIVEANIPAKFRRTS